MTKKKVLIATDSFLPKRDGVTVFLSEVIPKLKHKYDITVIGPNYGEYKPEGFKLIQFPLIKIKVGDFYTARPKLKVVKQEVEKADVVFNQSLGPIGDAAIKYANRKKKPVLAYMHLIEWELFPAGIKRFKFLAKVLGRVYAKHFYNKCSLLMCPYLEQKEMLKKHGIRRPETVIVRLGLDTKRFVPPEDKKRAKQKIGIDTDRTVIGYVGRIAREKDLLTLLEAFNNLQAEWDNTTLLIVGGGLKDIEGKFSTAKNVKHVGFQDDVVPYLQAMDIFVLPSLTETTSIATIEAMACGCAVLVTPNGYIKRYIKNKKNGLFFPKKNSTVLRLKLDALLKHPTHIKVLGQRARRTAERTFNWDRTVKDIELLIEQF